MTPRGNPKRRGAVAERLVALRLAAAGWQVLARNLRVGKGELDLVAIDPGPPRMLAVIEVRWRGRRDYGLAEESLDRRKRAAMRRTVGALLASGTLSGDAMLPRLPHRIDLVAVDRGPDGRVCVRHHRGVRL